MARTKVHVPQADGELSMVDARRLDGVRTWRVEDHLVTADNDVELELLLAHVDGAEVAPAKEQPAAGNKQQTPPQ